MIPIIKLTGMLLRSSSSRSRLRFSSPPSPRRGSSTYKPNVLSKDPYIPIYAGLTTLLTLGILTIYKNYKLTNEMLREEVLVRNDIISALHENYHQAVENKDMSTLIAPTLINLCWGAASTYNRHDFTGGVGGATMRYSPEKDFVSNRGLQRAISFLEPIKSQHPLISYSDLWTLAAVVAIESLGGPVVPWVSGRADEDGPKEGVDESRCPVADSGSIENDIDHIKVLFGRIGGLAFKHIVALFGVHGVGHCHEDASGYKGSWTRDVTTFSNQYFRVLLNEKWKLTTGKNGQRQYQNEDGTLYVLPVDIALIQDPEFRAWVEYYAENEEEFLKEFSVAFTKLINNGVEPTTVNRGYISRILGF